MQAGSQALASGDSSGAGRETERASEREKNIFFSYSVTFKGES